jgi:hypothetical protein
MTLWLACIRWSLVDGKSAGMRDAPDDIMERSRTLLCDIIKRVFTSESPSSWLIESGKSLTVIGDRVITKSLTTAFPTFLLDADAAASTHIDIADLLIMCAGRIINYTARSLVFRFGGLGAHGPRPKLASAMVSASQFK